MTNITFKIHTYRIYCMFECQVKYQSNISNSKNIQETKNLQVYSLYELEGREAKHERHHMKNKIIITFYPYKKDISECIEWWTIF